MHFAWPIVSLAIVSSSSLVSGAVECPGQGAACQVFDDGLAGGLHLLQLDAKDATPSGLADSAGSDYGRTPRLPSASASQKLRLDGVSKAPGSLLGLHTGNGIGGAPERLPDIDCTLYPTLCEAPFDCQSNPPSSHELERWGFVGAATEDGHTNFRLWCASPKYADTIVKYCLKERDLKTSAQATFNWTVENGIDQLDGSYCFMEGHCTNMEVTYNTTVEEAEALCDAKYGHEQWTTVKVSDLNNMKEQDPNGMSEETGFHSRGLTTYYGKMACAMGNFHCDVIYCRDTYCKKPEYVEKYAHLAPAS